MYGASGTYMLGSFDGRVFSPVSGKYNYGNGALYAAQTIENIPASDGRRIQIGWGRISHPGMPFNQMFLIPTELTLRTTKEGLRLYSCPVKEADMLGGPASVLENSSAPEASELLNKFRDSSAVRIKITLKLFHATDAGIRLNGQDILRYDMNFNTVNGAFYSPEDRTSMEISADIIIDRTSAEIFIDGGAFSYALERRVMDGDNTGFYVFGDKAEVKRIEVCALKSIWN
jgi:fructan beta-fructosidase